MDSFKNVLDKLKSVVGEWPLRVAEFHKESYDQFRKDWLDTFCEPNDEELRDERTIADAYDTLSLPTRSTSGSADYDFFSPLNFILDSDEDIIIPTGIRVKMLLGFKLAFYPRSGLVSKYFLRIANTIPQIDSDYFNSSNEGHIFLRIRNEGKNRVVIHKGDRFIQASIEVHGITIDDNVNGVRNGGFGSTGK